MSIAFYVADGDRFTSTEHSRGPWNPLFQHAGPPAALLGRAIEGLAGGEDFVVTRFTVELLRSVPVDVLSVDARLVRPGKRVQLAEATMADADGPVALARAWRMRRDGTVCEPSSAEPATFASPTESRPADDFNPWGGASYFSAVEWRIAAGHFMDPGPATVWMRMRGALVDGEQPSPLARVLVAADSGNGVSMELSMEAHLFVNTELTVHLFREPAGEWVCLDAQTRLGPYGVGLATSHLFDATGRFGIANQALLVRSR